MVKVRQATAASTVVAFNNLLTANSPILHTNLMVMLQVIAIRKYLLLVGYPQRNQLVRTITSNSITTANNGVLEVTPIVEKNITNANQKRIVKSGSPALAGDGTKPIDSNAKHSRRSDDQYLPATSQLYGVLITGVEAPTSLSSQEEPLGVTFRVKRDVFLPNNYRMDLRDCNLLGTARGYGFGASLYQNDEP